MIIIYYCLKDSHSTYRQFLLKRQQIIYIIINLKGYFVSVVVKLDQFLWLSASLRPVSGCETSEAHVLVFQVLVDAVFGAFDAQTGLFHPAECTLRGGQEALVDSNYPHLQRLRHPPDLTHILRVEVTWRQKKRACQRLKLERSIKPSRSPQRGPF